MTPPGMADATAIADAVLYEGYLLYPYRASAAKNVVRWQWGVVMPPAFAESGGERADTRADLLLEPRDGAALHVRLRFLHLRARRVQVRDDAGWHQVASATVAGTEHTTWDEAVEREVDVVLPTAELLAGERVEPFTLAGETDVEPLSDTVRLVRETQALHGELRLSARPLPGPFGGVRLRLDVRNTSDWTEPDATRPAALGHALIAAHTLLTLSGGRFLSLVDPPEWAAPAARECVNEGTWPVLAGAPDADDTVLCSPIILYDHPAVAAESAGNLFDGTEIDEILTLRTMTLTDEEKRQARATDERAAQLLDRVDHLPPELLDRLHGTIRQLRAVTGSPAEDPVPWWDPGADTSVAPETDGVVIDGVTVANGSHVRLRPGPRADAHDMFWAGREAVVRAVLRDVDDRWHLAVTLADDEGADLFAAHGRYRYFGVDEVEPLAGERS